MQNRDFQSFTNAVLPHFNNVTCGAVLYYLVNKRGVALATAILLVMMLLLFLKMIERMMQQMAAQRARALANERAMQQRQSKDPKSKEPKVAMKSAISSTLAKTPQNEAINSSRLVRNDPIDMADFCNKDMWPLISAQGKDFVPQKVEPKMRGFVDGFRFNDSNVGSVPPRVDAVRMFKSPNAPTDKSFQEMDVSYTGDASYNFGSPGVENAGVSKMRAQGQAKVTLKPETGDMDVTFMSPPDLDFELFTDDRTPPGTKRQIRTAMQKTFMSFFGHPNSVTVNAPNEVAALAKEQQGVTRVNVAQGKNLVPLDQLGSSYPYAVASMGPQSKVGPASPNSVNPTWDLWCDFQTDPADPNKKLKIDVYDFDQEGTNDPSLGKANVSLEPITKSRAPKDLWVPLERNKQGGQVLVGLTPLTISTDYSDLETTLKELKALKAKDLHSALLTLRLHSANHLPKVNNEAPSPTALVRVGKEKIQSSSTKSDTSDPVFEEEFKFLVADPTNAALDMTLRDKTSGKKLGDFTYDANRLKTHPNLNTGQQTYSLSDSGNHNATVTASMRLGILKNESLPRDEKGFVIFPKRGDSAQEDAGLFGFNPEERENLQESRDAADKDKAKVQVAEKERLRPPVPKKSQGARKAGGPSGAAGGAAGAITAAERSRWAQHEGEVIGSINLSICYENGKLEVIVRGAKFSPGDIVGLPDCYAKVYMESPRTRVYKGKTETIKNDYNPVFEETMYFKMGIETVKENKLVVVVTDAKQLYPLGRDLGEAQVRLDLYNFEDEMTFVNRWFDVKTKG